MIVGISDRGDLVVLVGSYDSGFGGHWGLLWMLRRGILDIDETISMPYQKSVSPQR